MAHRPRDGVSAGEDKHATYARLTQDLGALLAGESDPIANAANTAALLFEILPEINWVGFYFIKQLELVVGPFQGRPACVRITLGKGICGLAAARRQTIIVSNVRDFPGHIACDGASQSEIVVPLISGDELLGVLDLDSPKLARFDSEDAVGLECIAKIFVASLRPTN